MARGPRGAPARGGRGSSHGPPPAQGGWPAPPQPQRWAKDPAGEAPPRGGPLIHPAAGVDRGALPPPPPYAIRMHPPAYGATGIGNPGGGGPAGAGAGVLGVGRLAVPMPVPVLVPVSPGGWHGPVPPPPPPSISAGVNRPGKPVEAKQGKLRLAGGSTTNSDVNNSRRAKGKAQPKKDEDETKTENLSKVGLQTLVGQLKSRVEELEKSLQKERKAKEELKSKCSKRREALKKQIETKKKRWRLEKEKMFANTIKLERRHQEKIRLLEKKFEAERNRWERDKEKELSALRKTLRIAEGGATTAKERAAKEAERVGSRLKKLRGTCDVWKQKSKVLQKDLKKKERALLKMSPPGAFSRKRQRASGADAAGENSGGEAAGAAAPPPKRSKHDVKWDRQFKALQDFHREHGHCNVPKKHGANPELARWVIAQRSAYKCYKLGGDHGRSAITLDRIQLLKSVGFVFSLAPQRNWEGRFADLAEYARENGHCNVPQQGTGGLGEFVMKNRQNYRRGALAKDKIRRLESIGFQWSLRNRGGTLEERMMAHAVQRVELERQQE